MNIRRVFRKRIRRDDGGVHLDADINALVAGNVDEAGSTSAVSSRQRIVQRSGRGARRTRNETTERREVNDDG